MHAVKFLHNILRRSCPAIHVVRLEAILSAIPALISGRRLSIAGVGRALPPGSKTKHRIKKIDRLVGNPHLALERETLYRALAQLLIGSRPRPVLLVDWSDARVYRSLQLLRASIAVDGRSVTLYEEVHPLSLYDNRAVRERFLARLRDCIPASCRPIVITAAGFRVSWYRQIEAMGWDWISRVRGRALYRTVYGKRRQDKRSRECARRQTEPWLLVTSLRELNAEKICKIYSYRVQIEGTFRNMKNAQWGLHLNAHCTRTAKRLEGLVLLGTLATFVAYLTGLGGAALNLQREYQANTSKRRVLSYVYLGLELLHDADRRLRITHIGEALVELTNRIAATEQT